MDESLESWFKREALAHDEMLRRYLARLCPLGHKDHGPLTDPMTDEALRAIPVAVKARIERHREKAFADRDVEG